MARCHCDSQSGCDCFVYDDGYGSIDSGVTYSIINNNTTMVRGTGEFFQPYSIDNIHDPNFVPPLAKVFKNNGFMAAGSVTFDGVSFSSEGMYNVNQPDRVTVIREGLYLVGFDVSFDLAFNTSLSSFEYSAFVVHHLNPSGITTNDVKHRYFETTSIWPLTVRSSQSRILPFWVLPGDYFTLSTFTGIPTLATQATMWVCYI